jgi:hypothetical protein
MELATACCGNNVKEHACGDPKTVVCVQIRIPWMTNQSIQLVDVMIMM